MDNAQIDKKLVVPLYLSSGDKRMEMKRDSNLDTLLALDGETFGLDIHGCWVKFEAHRVEATDERTQ